MFDVLEGEDVLVGLVAFSLDFATDESMRMSAGSEG